MRRRTFITTATATIATASIAGCSGILGDDGGGGSSGPVGAVEAYVDAYDGTDPSAVEAALHSESPETGQIPTEKELETIGMSLQSSEVIEGPEDGQALVEAKTKVTFVVNDEEQTETTTDTIEVRQEDGEWKYYGEP